MASRVLQSFARAVVLASVVSVTLASLSEATRPVRRTARRSSARGFNLFAGSANVVMNVNRVQCNINTIGESCVDSTNSPSLGGGFWPKGSPNQYIFNSGLQIAAIIPGAPTTAFPWPGDTVGAFFFDPRGDQAHGEGRTNVFNALLASDLADWPTAANIADTSLFHASLIGRQTVSQQDTWVRFWDGNTNLTNGRPHPMGLLVEQRGLAWNFPSGNQDIIYFLYRFVNITSTDPAKYAGLADFGYSAADITGIVAIAQEFQQRSEAAYNVQIPDSGFTWSNIFAAFAQDPDVGNAGSNYSNANLVFDIAMAYKSDFRENSWQFPATINSAPFASAPGFEGVKYLASPQNIGIAMSGNTTNGGAFPDAVGVSRLWRNLSGNLLPTDGVCSAANPQSRRFCHWAQAISDTRFFESSGPFTLDAGETAVIVVAYIHAAPVATAPAFVAAPPMLPLAAFNLSTFVGGNMVPGLAVAGNRIAAGTDSLRNVDRAAGWVSHADLDADGVIEQCQQPRPAACVTEVSTVPRSLYNKSLVAQAVFDNKFLLPFAPEIPAFFLLPGDNNVTIVWQKSVTETIGDPFFSIAADPTSPLFDPNFRRLDVEGYRIWRGRTQSEMEVVASFDYAGTFISDYTGVFVAVSYGSQCAPELGLNTAPGSCPVTFAAVPTPASPHVDHQLAGNVIQVLPGGRSELAPIPPATRGAVMLTATDTAVTGGASGLPGLTDTGISFSFVDNGVRNGFRYFYAVTAFDMNSIKSGPSSLESPLVTKTTTPRVGSGQEAGSSVSAVRFLAGDNSLLDPSAADPTLNPATGIFSGPAPATNALSIGFASALPALLSSGTVTVTVDSVLPGSWFNGAAPATYWFTGQGAGAAVKFPVSILGVATSNPTDITASNFFAATTAGQAQAGRFGGDSTFSIFGVSTVAVNGDYRYTNQYRGAVNGDPSPGFATGPRWWEGAGNENVTDPVGINCFTVATFSCVLTDFSRNAGALTGVTIMAIASYSTIASTEPVRTIEGITSSVFRAADFKWYWGGSGAVDSVVDVTHKVRVPFNTRIGPSWGILNDSSFTNVNNVGAANTRPQDQNNARLTFGDLACVDPAPRFANSCGRAGLGAAQVPAFLMNHAILSPVNITGSTYAGTTAVAAGAATGNGFMVYLNGHFFLMQMAALPAAGTVWNMRAYAGNIINTVGSYAFAPATRPAAVPGLRAQFDYTGSTFDPTVSNDSMFRSIHTVPDPYYVTSSLEITANTKVLRFVNLPSQAIIRIYSSSGILVNVLSHNDVAGGSEQTWNLRNRNNQFVASGVYFYHVESSDGKTKVGRFTVINYAQ